MGTGSSLSSERVPESISLLRDSQLCTQGPRCLGSKAEWLWFLASAQSQASCLLLNPEGFQWMLHRLRSSLFGWIPK